MPRASLRQCGAKSPEKAGTMTTSPLSGHGTGECLDLGRVVDDAEAVAEPADERPRDGDRTLERVGRGILAEAGRHGRDQAVARLDRSVTGVHQHEAARAIRALELAGLETGLPEEGGLLIAQIARDRDPGQVAGAEAIDLRR